MLVKVNNVSEIDRISSQITAMVPKTRVLTPKTLITTVTSQLNTLTHILAMITLIATLISLPLIALISVMVANERIRDVGILRALGAPRKVIFRLIFGESIIIAIYGAIIGIIVSWTILVLFQELFVKITGAPLTIPDTGVMIQIICSALILTILVGGLASLYPAWKSAVMEPYDAMRTGEV